MTPRTLALVLAATVLVSGLAGVAADRLWNEVRGAQIRERLALQPQTRPLYQHRVSLFARLKTAPRVVMLGDSVTQNGEWAELIGPQVANRGVGGDTSAALLQRLEASVPASAKTVVIMIGLNDLKASDWTAQRSTANVSAILDRLKGRRIILQSVLYTSQSAQNGQIDILNTSYAALCTDGRCHWLDLNPAVAPLGRLTKAESLDSRHLTGKAYLAWADRLKTELADLGE